MFVYLFKGRSNTFLRHSPIGTYQHTQQSDRFYICFCSLFVYYFTMIDMQHTIRIAAKRSGLSPHVIRVWEKRYDAVSPDRTDTNRRRYSDAEIERLTLLRLATEAGHTISSVAQAPTDKLRTLLTDAPAANPLPARKTKTGTESPAEIESALAAIRELNAQELEAILGRAALRYGQHGLLENVVARLAALVGERWRAGDLTAAHEHFASAVIRNYLMRNARPYAQNGNSPLVVVATPAGQLHELGAVMAAAAANDLGWQVIYLGTSLPAAEIAGAVLQNRARVVALSLVFPGDDPSMPLELENLRKLLPAETQLVVGGRAAESYAPTLTHLGITHTRTLGDFYELLVRLRLPRK